MGSCGWLGWLCGAGRGSLTCHLCMEDVGQDAWSSGQHRKQCASRNTAKLSSFPPHPALPCPHCARWLRLWPDQALDGLQGPPFTCSSGEPGCPGRGREVPARGQNRYCCFFCAYDMCSGCAKAAEARAGAAGGQGPAALRVEREGEQGLEKAEDVRGLERAMELARIKVDEVTRVPEEKEKAVQQPDENQNTALAAPERQASVLLDDDNIPLIDLCPSSEEDDKEEEGGTEDEEQESVGPLPAPEEGWRPKSCSLSLRTGEGRGRSRGSVASLGAPPESLGMSLLSKPGPANSPDIFHLRAPLVSCENFLSPSVSRETLPLSLLSE